MPFKSKAQARAAFSGALGPKMKAHAEMWAHETPGGIKSLPQHVGKSHSSHPPTRSQARKSLRRK